MVITYRITDASILSSEKFECPSYSIVSMEPLEAGSRFIETLWYSYASRIVDKIIELYKVNDETAIHLREKFLKRGDYVLKLE